MKLKFCGGTYFLVINSNFYMKQYTNVNLTGGIFNVYLPKYSLKMWLPWQQEMVYTYYFGFKSSPINVEEKSQSFRGIDLPFQRYL